MDAQSAPGTAYRRVVIALTMEVPDGCGLSINQRLADEIAAEVSEETGLKVEGLLAPKVGVFHANGEFGGFALLDADAEQPSRSKAEGGQP